jgi:site-specific recombinase XerD
VMRAAGDGAHGRRLRGLMVILWRAGLRVQEALALTEGDASRHTSSAMPTRSRWHAKGVPLIVIQRQLGHSNLGITSVYLQGIDNAEIIETVHARRAPMVPVSASLGP